MVIVVSKFVLVNVAKMVFVTQEQVFALVDVSETKKKIEKKIEIQRIFLSRKKVDGKEPVVKHRKHQIPLSIFWSTLKHMTLVSAR